MIIKITDKRQRTNVQCYFHMTLKWEKTAYRWFQVISVSKYTLFSLKVKFSQNQTGVQLFNAFLITGSSGSVHGICIKTLNSLCILLIWTLFLKHQHFCSLWPIFPKLCAAWWQGTRLFLPHVKYATFTTLVTNCISVIFGHYHGNMQLYPDFLGVSLTLHISTTFCTATQFLPICWRKMYNNNPMCTKEFRVNKRLTLSEEGTSLKAWSNPILPPILWFCLIFN